MKTRPAMDAKLWEYVVYFFVTTFLLLVGLFLLILGGIYAIPRAVRHGGRTAVLFLISGTLILGGVAGYLYYSFEREIDLGAREVTVTIKSGDDFTSVSRKLEDEGVISSRMLMKYAARWSDVDKKLRPGQYKFTGKNSVLSVIDKLRKADRLVAKITIFEGAPIWRVAAILKRQLDLDSSAVIALSRDSAFLAGLGVPTLEGYLYPETYFIPKGSSAAFAIREMVSMFRRQTDSLLVDLRQDLNPHEIITLASIVQAEAKVDSEAPMIAAVYLNRLKHGWTLDADPTVIYGLGGLDRALLRKDIDSLTRYNTYRVPGLPPTPINSPGLPAIRAVLYPDTSDYFFFVASDNGTHYFSRTNEQHNQMRRRVKLEARRGD